MSLTTAQIDAIEDAARAAHGQRERRCQVAMANIYHASGALPSLNVAQGERDWARACDRSLIEEWVDECPYFESVYNAKATPDLPAMASADAGDLLGFRLGHTLHHVAILLRSGRMVHVFAEHGVRVAPCIPEKWAKRITRVWRPVQKGGES